MLALSALAQTVGRFSTVNASEDHLPAPAHPWDHVALTKTYDHAALRRGFKVYSEVCATCHGLERIAWRNLVNVCLTEDEAKTMAAEREYRDGPDDDGEMFDRPGKLADYLKGPYENENAARAANNGAYPPDLSLMVKARVDGLNYLFALLTGYREAPPGVDVGDKAYNPYFPGGGIGMPPPLTVNGLVEYEDGTEASVAQMAKDVTVFLNWAAEPEHDQRKRMGWKSMVALSMMLVPSYYWKKHRWSNIKTRKLKFF